MGFLTYLPFLLRAKRAPVSPPSVYGTLPELVSEERGQRAFGRFYSGTIGSGAVSPAIYSLFGDTRGVTAILILAACIVLLTLPMAWLLNPTLRQLQTNARARAST